MGSYVRGALRNELLIDPIVEPFKAAVLRKLH